MSDLGSQRNGRSSRGINVIARRIRTADGCSWNLGLNIYFNLSTFIRTVQIDVWIEIHNITGVVEEVIGMAVASLIAFVDCSE